MHRTIGFTVLLVLSTSLVSALTPAEYQAYIDEINAAAKKQKTLPAPKTTTPTPTVSKPSTQASKTTTTPSIRTLSRGMRGADVTALQKVLISQGLLSSGSATGYFGPLTEAAVKKFQTTNKIVSSGSPATTGYGLVGPKTRAVIAQAKPVTPGGLIAPSVSPGGGVVGVSGGGGGGSTPQSGPPTPTPNPSPTPITPPPLPMCTLTASPASIVAGQSATLSWTSTQTTRVYFADTSGIVEAALQGSKTVNPSETKMYHAGFEGPGGGVGCDAKVTVTPVASSLWYLNDIKMHDIYERALLCGAPRQCNPADPSYNSCTNNSIDCAVFANTDWHPVFAQDIAVKAGDYLLIRGSFLTTNVNTANPDAVRMHGQITVNSVPQHSFTYDNVAYRTACSSGAEQCQDHQPIYMQSIWQAPADGTAHIETQANAAGSGSQYLLVEQYGAGLVVARFTKNPSEGKLGLVSTKSSAPIGVNFRMGSPWSPLDLQVLDHAFPDRDASNILTFPNTAAGDIAWTFGSAVGSDPYVAQHGGIYAFRIDLEKTSGDAPSCGTQRESPAPQAVRGLTASNNTYTLFSQVADHIQSASAAGVKYLLHSLGGVPSTATIAQLQQLGVLDGSNNPQLSSLCNADVANVVQPPLGLVNDSSLWGMHFSSKTSSGAKGLSALKRSGAAMTSGVSSLAGTGDGWYQVASDSVDVPQGGTVALFGSTQFANAANQQQAMCQTRLAVRTLGGSAVLTGPIATGPVSAKQPYLALPSDMPAPLPAGSYRVSLEATCGAADGAVQIDSSGTQIISAVFVNP